MNLFRFPLNQNNFTKLFILVDRLNIKLNYYQLVIVSIIVVYFGILSKFVVNIPIADDYMAILRFLADFIESTTIIDKLKLLFAQHAEHRILFTRLNVLVNYWVLGKIDFRFLILIGNSCLIMILFLLSRLINCTKDLKWFWMLVISLLLFSFQSQQNSFWAMASLGNFGVICFVLVSFYFIKNSYVFGFRFIFGIIMSVLTVFTSGNGLLILPLLILISATKPKILKLILIASISLILLFYFRDYHQIEYSQFNSDRLFHPFEILGYFFAFSGAVFAVVPSSSIGTLSAGLLNIIGYGFPIIAGMVLFGYFLWLIRIRYYRNNPVIFMMISFILLTALVVSLSRSGIGGAFQSRYKINSLILLILSLISLAELIPVKLQKKIQAIIVICSVLFYGFSVWFNLNRYLKMRDTYISGAESYYKTPDSTSLYLIYYPEGSIRTSNAQQAAQTILKRCESMSIYTIPGNHH